MEHWNPNVLNAISDRGLENKAVLRHQHIYVNNEVC